MNPLQGKVNFECGAVASTGKAGIAKWRWCRKRFYGIFPVK